MKRLFFWIIGLPAVVLIVLLSIANRKPVTFSFDPLFGADPAFSLELPLFLLLFGAGFFGLLVGWLVGWSGQRRWRRRARSQEREVARLRSLEGQADRPGMHKSGQDLVVRTSDSAESKPAP